MGVWSASIEGNDTAADLKTEYSILFGKYDVETAVRKLDEYVKANYDEDEYKVYIYSVARYMWKYGILTEEMKTRALNLIENDDMHEYAEVSNALLRQRKKVLEGLRCMLSSPQPSKKKIKLDINPNRFLEIGDIISLKLLESGKYILIQKVYDSIGAGSSIEEDMKNIYPYFILLDYCSDREPSLKDAVNSRPASYIDIEYSFSLQGTKPLAQRHEIVKNYVFFCEGKPYHFAKRKYRVLGNIETKINYARRKRRLELCCLWRQDDEQEMLMAIRGKYVLDVETGSISNYNALDWLYQHQDKVLLNAYEEAQVKLGDEKKHFEIIYYLMENGYRNEDWKDR